MASQVALPRNLILFGVTLPLAALLGVLLADPMDRTTILVTIILVGVLLIPVLLRWHHPLLILSFNSGVSIFLLPGQPQVWMLMGGLSLGITILNCLLNKQQKFLNVPAVTWSLLFLAVVVIITAETTGGMGTRSLGGGAYGGKKYFYMLFAILAYFALSGQGIPKDRALFYVSMYLLSGIAISLSNVIYLAGPRFYWLYLFFPVDYAISQAMEDLQLTTGIGRFSRLSGITFAGVAAFSYMQMRYGIRGLFDFSKPWRLFFWLLIIGVSLLGGFRSVLVVFFLFFAVQYWLEGLFRSRITLILLVAGTVLAAFLIMFSTQLPMSVQRSISFLPVEVHPAARVDAQASTDWRLRMWKVLYPDIPKYFWKGKGYTASPSDYFLAQESVRRGLAEDIEVSLIAGDYHNGPLSVIIPFGIWGMLGFLGFLVAAGRVLYCNYRYGDPDLKNINLFLLAAFIARVIFYFFFFGAINADLVLFAGLVGLSISINGGMIKPQPESPPPLPA